MLDAFRSLRAAHPIGRAFYYIVRKDSIGAAAMVK